MNNRLFGIIIGLLGIWMLYEIVSNLFLLVLFLAGILIVVAAATNGNRPFRNYKGNNVVVIVFGAFLIILPVFLTSAAWVMMVVAVIFKVGQNQELFNTIKEPLFKKESDWKEREFISVKFKEDSDETVKKIRRKWFGDENFGDHIYEWEDVNYTKIAGDSIIDLGNTILPKENNIVLIRKGFGNIKLLVPEEVAVSLDLSVFLGKVKIGREELALKNETLKWRSERYENSSRKIKLVSNVLFGEIEVVFI